MISGFIQQLSNFAKVAVFPSFCLLIPSTEALYVLFFSLFVITRQLPQHQASASYAEEDGRRLKAFFSQGPVDLGRKSI